MIQCPGRLSVLTSDTCPKQSLIWTTCTHVNSMPCLEMTEKRTQASRSLQRSNMIAVSLAIFGLFYSVLRYPRKPLLAETKSNILYSRLYSTRIRHNPHFERRRVLKVETEDGTKTGVMGFQARSARCSCHRGFGRFSLVSLSASRQLYASELNCHMRSQLRCNDTNRCDFGSCDR